MDDPRYFEQFVVGEAYETLGRTITETDFVVHAGHTGDFFPHHMDAEWCRTQKFGQRIAHGTLVLSVAAGMTARQINPVAFSYGYDRVRFIKPVHIGDTVHVEAMTTGLRPDPKRSDRGFVDEECKVLNQRQDAVLVFTHVYSVQRRPEAAGQNHHG